MVSEKNAFLKPAMSCRLSAISSMGGDAKAFYRFIAAGDVFCKVFEILGLGQSEWPRGRMAFEASYELRLSAITLDPAGLNAKARRDGRAGLFTYYFNCTPLDITHGQLFFWRMCLVW
jgi:hypothetical protein